MGALPGDRALRGSAKSQHMSAVHVLSSTESLLLIPDTTGSILGKDKLYGAYCRLSGKGISQLYGEARLLTI
uniref:Uncharacterized protein n=1 Tax=Knipowitschia caucasica TaxID=637954 RepID=A0AAV2MBM1_KNICA